MPAIVHSFDIFDTALTRTWAKPIDLFWELGVQLRTDQLIYLSPEAWQQLRIDAEKQARRKTQTNEITIYDIYDELSNSLGWSPEQAKTAMHYEIDLEHQSLCPVPTTKKYIQSLRQQGLPIIFLSDMYLPAAVLQGLLEQHDLISDDDALYVSGDIGFNKASGTLFQHYLSNHNLQPSQLHHTGDNLRADVEVPTQMGIQTHLFTAAHLNRYEQLISEDETLSHPLKSIAHSD
jgi:predicted HAD superfamily hydrolase